MKTLLIAFGIALTLAFASGETKKKVTYRKTQEVNFEDQSVDGKVNTPDGAYLLQKRGVRFIPQDRLVAMVRTAVSCDLQFTAHSVGDGAVHALLEAYAAVDRDSPIRKTSPCISHSNFMSREAIEEAARLGVMPDIQPAWLYLDTHTLVKQFGEARLRYFQPLRSLFEAGAVAGACGGR